MYPGWELRSRRASTPHSSDTFLWGTTALSSRSSPSSSGGVSARMSPPSPASPEGALGAGRMGLGSFLFLAGETPAGWAAVRQAELHFA